MRRIPIVFAVAVVIAFAAEAADPVAVQAGQAPATVSGPSASPATEVASPQGATVQASASAAAESTSSPAASATPVAAGADTTSSAPVTLKLTTVPPPADFKIPAGYRPVKQGLETIYCTSVTPIGSRMPQKYCLTRAQLEESQRQAEVARRDLAEKSGTCAGGGCGAN
jgi:hypothetical protein